MTPNTLAWAVLAIWPIAVLVVFASGRARARLASTTAYMVLLPTMFLPPAIQWKVPGVPYLDKHRVAFLSVYVALLAFQRPRLSRTARGAWFERIALLLLLAGVTQTVATNHDALVYGPTQLPGLTSHDIVSISAELFLDLYIPFWVGQRVFQTEQDLRDLFRALTACGLIYLPLAGLEVRLSPQLNMWIYGYQHAFLQSMRGEGFRPMVFMEHGLAVAFFAATGFIAALGLQRVRDPCRPGPWSRVGWQAVLLALCKSWGSILYSAFALVSRPLLKRRLGAWILVVAIVVVVTFPATRFTGVFPAQQLVELVSRVSVDRAQSLGFRFDNEDMLLRRAMLRPVFGWGTFGRNRVFADWGQDVSVTDGQWIIQLGIFGAVGLAGLLVLVLVPLLRFIWNWRRIPPGPRSLVHHLALVVTVCAVDILPNAWADRLPLVYAGALFTLAGELAGRAARRRRAGRDQAIVRVPVAAPQATTPARPAPVAASRGAGSRA